MVPYKLQRLGALAYLSASTLHTLWKTSRDVCSIHCGVSGGPVLDLLDQALQLLPALDLCCRLLAPDVQLVLQLLVLCLQGAGHLLQHVAEGCLLL